MKKESLNKNLQYTIELALLGTATSLPFGYKFSSPLIIVLLILILLKNRKPTYFKKEFLPLILLFFALAFSATYTKKENWLIAWKALELNLPLIVFPIILTFYSPEKEVLKKALLYFAFSCLAIATISHIDVLIRLTEQKDPLYEIFTKKYSYHNLPRFSIHGTYLAMYHLTSIAILYRFYILPKRTPFRHKLYIILIIFYLSFFIVHLSVRTPIAVLGALLLGLTIHFSISRSSIKLAISGLGIIVSFLAVLLIQVRTTLYRFREILGMEYGNGTYVKSGSEKIQMWTSAFNANKNILIGNGLGDYKKDIVFSYEANGLTSFFKREYNAHNLYIEAFVAQGIIGVGIIFYFIIFNIISAIRKDNFLLFAVTAIFWICCFTESMLNRNAGSTFLGFFFSIIPLLNSKSNHNDK